MSTAERLMTPAGPTAPPVRASLKDRIVRASGWTALGYGGTLVLRLGNSLILTRLLAPEVFGLIAIVATLAMMVTLLSDIGLRQAIVHSKHGDDPRMLDTAWTMQIVRGALIWVACCLGALALHGAQQSGAVTAGSVYASPQLPLLLALGTMSALFEGFHSTKRFTADRRIDQKRVVLIELGAMLVGTVVSVLLALQLRTVWALVFGGWVGVLVAVVCGHLLLHGHPNRLAWDGSYARQIFGFGKWILASSLLYVLAMHSDKLLLGVWVAPAVLGCYAIAQSLSQVLEMALGRVIGQVAGPAFAELMGHSPHRLREVYLRLRLVSDLAFVLSAGFLFAIGPWLVGLLYDPRYAQAGTLLQILSFTLLFGRYNVSTNAYLALQMPKAQALMNFVRVAAFFIVVPAAYSAFGVDGAYWAIALHAAAIAPVVWWLDHRFGIGSLRQEALALAAWPLGWGAGLALVSAANWVSRHG
jgi:O-antigen/teichoic acid export membrane protein